jgi:voltage-gated potassium channel
VAPHRLAIAVVTGLLVALLVRAMHRGRVRRLDHTVFPGDDRTYRNVSVASAFLCGALVILAHDNLRMLVVLTGLTLVAIALCVRVFFHRVGQLIRPGRYAEISDVTFLIGVFSTLLIAFTLVNLSIDNIHSELAKASGTGLSGGAFAIHDGSLIDYLYFSVVLMTTVGFGDISPIHPAARVAVSIECLASYVMFALMVGVITRGVVFRADEGETPDAGSP